MATPAYSPQDAEATGTLTGQQSAHTLAQEFSVVGEAEETHMAAAGRLLWWASVALVAVLFGCGTGPAALAPGGTQIDNQPDLEPDNGNSVNEPEYTAINDGGGDLADRLGGSTYTGQATGPLASGDLTLTFTAEGMLANLGGTVLGSFFGFPSGTEVVFDYQAQSVTGTYRADGAADRPLEAFLAETGQSIDLRSVSVTLAGDSLLVVTNYAASLTGQPAGQRTIALQGTLRFQTNEDLQGGLVFPNYTDAQVPTFSLLRQ